MDTITSVMAFVSVDGGPMPHSRGVSIKGGGGDFQGGNDFGMSNPIIYLQREREHFSMVVIYTDHDR